MKQIIEKIASEIVQEVAAPCPTPPTEIEEKKESIKAMNVGELRKAMLEAKENDSISVFTKDGAYNVTNTEANPKMFFIHTT